MYSTNELIDKIRELEEKQLSEVFVVSCHGSSSEGEPFGQVLGVYQSAEDLPSQNEIHKVLADGDHEYYEQNKNDCCGGDENCCGTTQDKDEFREDHTGFSYSSYYDKAKERLLDPSNQVKCALVGTYSNNYEDTYCEVYATRREVQ